MGQVTSSSDLQIKKEQLNKKFQILEEQQQQYLKNIYEEQRISSQNQMRQNCSQEYEREGFLCFPRKKKSQQQNDLQRQVAWIDQLIIDLNQASQLFQDRELQWAKVMENSLKQVIASESSVVELKFQQRCDQDHLFVKLKNIEQEIKMDWLINYRKPRNIAREQIQNQESMLVPEERKQVKQELQKQSQTVMKTENVDAVKSRDKWDLFEKQKLSQSESQYNISEQQMSVEDVAKIRDINQKIINNFIKNNNEIFDEEMEQVFGKIELIMQSFSGSISNHPSTLFHQKSNSIKKHSNESGQSSCSNRNSLNQAQNQSQILLQGQVSSQKQFNSYLQQLSKEQQKEIIFGQIDFQYKIMNSIAFYQKVTNFFTTQIYSNRKNWLNKIIRCFVQIFTECWFNRSILLENNIDGLFTTHLSKLSSSHKSNKNKQKKKSNLENYQNGFIIKDPKSHRNQLKGDQVSLLQQFYEQKESPRGVQIVRNSDDSEYSEEDIDRLYQELKIFITIFRNLLKNYYSIPFIIEKFENSKLLIDDVLWNYVVNIIFDFEVNKSLSVYICQYEISVKTLTHQFQRYKQKFEPLKMKEPQFYKVKDQFCLNNLTIAYIFKQYHKKLKLQKQQIQLAQGQAGSLAQENSVKKINDKIEEIQEKQEENQQNEQDQNCQEENLRSSINSQTSKNQDLNSQSTLSNLDYSLMKLKEIQERKQERERCQQFKIQQGHVLPILLEEQESKYFSQEFVLSHETVQEEEFSEETNPDNLKQEGEEETKQNQDQNLQYCQINYERSISASDQTDLRGANSKKRHLQQDEIADLNTLKVKQLEKEIILDEIKEEVEQDIQKQYIPFDLCINALKQVLVEKKPIGKLRLILKVFDNIQRCIHKFYHKNNSNEKVQIGPEDLMDITVYILAKSQQYQIIHDINIVRSFITKNTEYSDKAGYYLQTLEAAFQYIIETEFNRLDENGYSRQSFSNSYKSFCGQEQK
ncbi:vacuolar sorting protein 9, VPS9 domain protein (macronuclear) [Tetrahymena thermophila SB210]|uniref:Vacuolar sorting protein 9, VPS9 domain protein n=1 Tax=Tetrahymena thermophila (strain SB210) TaxID=312017 RepID=Q24CA2_TETTS|nr:vacuolar sorting protein 9, VPS9 domain protein [Tetrahymena thermophila SB210]EAS05336.4 vacuolar sorting protein 9, VPS9 domain protein [Tetrahymena thermophila SB210]|eukprot:XP_001025581.4 vacuolar sorting protein 9, VPS9 domain protein [Tetrahymena thermophila SB210]